MTSKKIYIIIPTYNEKENLPILVGKISEELREYNYRILVVDDNSPDGTGQLAEKLKSSYPIEVLHRPGKLGLGSAYRDGFKYCLEHQADYIFEMDADGSHNPQDIPNLLAAVESGADMALASRKVKGGKIVGWGLLRHLYSNGAMFFARFLLHLKTHDITAGFRCFDANVFKKIDYQTITSNGYAFQVETIYRLEKAGFKIVEVPVTFIDRELGQSKLNKKDICEFFKVVLRLTLNL